VCVVLWICFGLTLSGTCILYVCARVLLVVVRVCSCVCASAFCIYVRVCVCLLCVRVCLRCSPSCSVPVYLSLAGGLKGVVLDMCVFFVFLLCQPFFRFLSLSLYLSFSRINSACNNSEIRAMLEESPTPSLGVAWAAAFGDTAPLLGRAPHLVRVTGSKRGTPCATLKDCEDEVSAKLAYAAVLESPRRNVAVGRIQLAFLQIDDQLKGALSRECDQDRKDMWALRQAHILYLHLYKLRTLHVQS
jgi:hypothetical protein